MIRVVLLALVPSGLLACDRPVCLVADEGVVFASEVTFATTPGGFGPGQPVAGVLALPGASFGKAFAGQQVAEAAGFDRVTGPASAPLTLVPGEAGRNLAVMRVWGENLLTGNGPAGFPRVDSTGEGAIAIRLDEAQGALALDLMGGEGGVATVQFLDAAGHVIDSHQVAPLGEGRLVFRRSGGIVDIAGLVLTSTDAEGIALRRVAFGLAGETS